MSLIFLIRCAAACAVFLLLPALSIAQPLRVQEVVRTTTGGTVRGFVAVVDLNDPDVDIVVTSPLPAGSGAEAQLIRTDTWQTQTGVTLAVNANFFATLPGNLADIIGLSISDGVVVSPVRQFGAQPDPAIIFRDDGTAEVGYIASTQLAGVTEAVAGVGPSNTDSIPGTMLVMDGVNTGATARVDPLNRNPRTAVGVNQDRTQLYIFVIDGRQTGWSVGMTLPELADFMIERGAWRAVNLDGGGSTSFVYQPTPGGPKTLNRPSDGAFRAVANHLGVRVTPREPALEKRPIRGVWLRPPSTISSLEATLTNLANAGITDLYLETFYHGVSTGRAGVFNARFAFDYLDQAIRAAAKYNIRLHAWAESGYWQFGTTGAYNFTNNPEWRSLNISTNDVGGDGTAGQVFANLVNPGVQQKLRDYCAELAGYTGLWGIQTDYHRFALDNNTGDVYPAPWSYDSWSRAQFQSMYGVDPITAADRTSRSHWSQFLSWRRRGISEAARQMNLGIRSVDPSVEFSAAVFATAMTSSAQLVKCQDWHTWATNGYVGAIVPMAYGSTTGSIQSDINTTKQFAAGARVIAGLAIVGTSPHPSITNQLDAIKAVGIEDFIFFDATAFSDANKRFELKLWLLNQPRVQKGDFNTDGAIDHRDRVLFDATYAGTPVPVDQFNVRYDLNGDGTIDSADAALFERYFAKYRFGEDGVVNERDIAALRACFGANRPIADIHHMYDLNGDGVVSYADQVILHGLLTEPVSPDLDVNGDGKVSIEDLYRQRQNPIDVNRDGVIDGADAALLESFLRPAEPADMQEGRD
jgi:uncharacterized lipoprotein YddW (UPF0748 family)